MSHELTRGGLWPPLQKAYAWLKNDFIPKKRQSVPVAIGLSVMILSAFVPASASVFLWWVNSWGAYVGAGLLAYGIYPLFAELSDDEDEAKPPPRN